MEHLLKYSKPATHFIEALVLGNGSLGASVYGDIARERISLNHDTFWSGTPRPHLHEGAYEALCEASEHIRTGEIAEGQKIIEERFNANFSQAFLPLGNLYIEAKHIDNSDYTRTLSLDEAIARVEYTTEHGKAKKEYFVSYPQGAMFIRLTSDFMEDYTLSFDTQMKYHSICAEGTSLTMTGKAPYLVHARGHIPAGESEQVIWDGEQEPISFTASLRVIGDGEVVGNGDRLIIKRARNVTVILVINTSFISYNVPPTKEHRALSHAQLDTLANTDYFTHKEEHIRDYQALYHRVSLDLCSVPDTRDTDERLREKNGTNGLYELLFNFGRYLTIASSREGSQATTLQGIWNEELVPPWQSNYTVNINTEMNYWPTLMCNLKECYGPLISFIRKVSDTGSAVAKHYYHRDGFVAHHNVDLWGMTNPVGLKTQGSAVYAFWNLSSGWLAHHLYEYYLYTHDEVFLREVAYPILCESAKFYLQGLEEVDGHLVHSPSTSPENTFQYRGRTQAVSRYTTMSQSIIQNLFCDVLSSAKLLGIEDELTGRIQNLSLPLALFRIGSKGQLLEWDEEYEETDEKHRHISHLFGLYPGTLLTTESTPLLTDACRKSLEGRGMDGTGWSLSWKINVSAKLKDGELAFCFMTKQLAPCHELGTNMSNGGGTYPNLLDAHPPFQIDGNFGYCAGVSQLLLQCEDGKIKLLPALPRAFRNGSVKGLVAHGDVTVDLNWQNGKLISCTLLCPRDITLTVQYKETEKTFLLHAKQKTDVIFS